MQFSQLRNLPEKLKLQLTSGSGSLDLKGEGRGPRDFTATAAARVATVEGKRAEKRFGIKSGAVDSRIIRSNGQLQVSGEAQFSGLSLDHRQGEARFAYRLAEGAAFLENAVFSFAGTTATIARLKALLPVKNSVAGAERYPLALEVAGGELHRGDLDLRSFAGSVNGSYCTDRRSSWLEGTADISVRQVAWQKKVVASPAMHLDFSRTGGRGTVSGGFLEGELNGKIGFDPLALTERVTFQLGIRNGRLAALGALLPRRGAATLSNGTVRGRRKRHIFSRVGLASRFNLKGSDIALTGSGGKTLMSGGGVDLAGSIAGSGLVIDKAVLSAGK